MVTLFADIGAGQWLRHVVGVLKLAGAIGPLVPAVAGVAAAGLTALMTGGPRQLPGRRRHGGTSVPASPVPW